jgi:nitroreductase
MDAYVALVSLRVVREYSDNPVPKEALVRILEAGRATGSSQNRQPWRFHALRSRSALDAMAEAVYAPENLRGCQAAIAVTTTAKSTFDAGKCAQNMALAAWSEGLGTAPNSAKEVERARRVLGAGEEETIATILSLGYPAKPWSPRAGDISGILRRIKRKPLEEITVWIE